jgi:hypothetical protein
MKAMLTYVLSALSGLVGQATGILINAPTKSAPLAFPPAGGEEPPSGIAAPFFDAHHDWRLATDEPGSDCATTRTWWTYFELDDLPAWALREIEQGLGR